MKSDSMTRRGLAAALAFLLPGAQAARAVEASAEAVGRQTSVAGSSEKFNEYRDVREGLFLDDLRLGASGETYFLEFEAREGGRDSEGYSLEGGRPGKFKASASYDRTPHNFSRGRHILSGLGTDYQGISSAVQAQLQANEQTRNERDAVTATSTVDQTGEDAVQHGIIRDLIANTDEKTFRIERRRSRAALEYNVTDRVRAWVKASDERRSGARQMGTGSYERYAQTAAAINGDGGHTSDMFVVHGMAVGEPIDYRTTALNLGAGYYDRKFSGDLEYTLSEFKDDLDSLTWANPFRSTDATATDANDVAANSYNRARYAKGRLALPPSHRAHDVAASASMELPLEGRLTGAFGYGAVTQDASLLPYTANTAIAGVGGAPANVTSAAALPVSSFGGEVRTLSSSLLLALRPAERLAVKAKYRNYNYDNRSPQVTFAGYAAFGESYWRAVKNDKNEAVRNVAVSYNRQTAEAGADYEVFGPLSVGGETFWDRWSYRNNRTGATDEVGLGGGAELHLGHALKAHGKYRWAHRAGENYLAGNRAGNPEAVGLVNFNWADRVRNRFDGGLTSTPADGVTLGLSGLYQNDDLGGEERFGYKRMEVKGVTFDASVAPTDALEVSLTLGKEERFGKIQNGAKDDAFNNTATALDDNWANNAFNPLNYWNTEIVDKVDTVALDASWRPGEKWSFSGGYSLSYGRTAYNTTNPNGADAVAAGYAQGTKLANGAAQDWPTVTSRLHELRLGGAYKLTQNVSFGLNYAFAKYMLSDFANVPEYGAGSSGENGTRFVLSGANRYDYTAHVVGAKVAMRF